MKKTITDINGLVLEIEGCKDSILITGEGGDNDSNVWIFLEGDKCIEFLQKIMDVMSE